MKVTFTVYGEPQAKQRPRAATVGGHARMYTPKKTVYYENLVKTEYVRQTKHFRFPDDTPLVMAIDAYLGIPKSISKRKREMMLAGKIRPTKKPDTDNTGKIIADSINGIAYRDDSCIVEMYIRKFYSDVPRVEVAIKTI